MSSFFVYACHRGWWQTICCNQPCAWRAESFDSVSNLPTSDTSFAMQMPHSGWRSACLVFCLNWRLHLYGNISANVWMFCLFIIIHSFKCSMCERNRWIRRWWLLHGRQWGDSLTACHLRSRQDLNIIKLDLYSLCIKYKQFYLIICVRPYGEHRHAPHIQCFVVSEKRIYIRWVRTAPITLPSNQWGYAECASGSLCTSEKQIWSKFWSESDHGGVGVGSSSTSFHPSWWTHIYIYTQTKSSAQIRDEIHSVQFTRRSDSWW